MRMGILIFIQETASEIVGHYVQGDDEQMHIYVCMFSQTIIEVPDAEFVCVVGSFYIIVSVSTVAAILALALVSLLLVTKYRGEIKIILYMKFGWHPFDCSDDTDIVGKVGRPVLHAFTVANVFEMTHLYARSMSLLWPVFCWMVHLYTRFVSLSWCILNHSKFGSLMSRFM